MEVNLFNWTSFISNVITISGVIYQLFKHQKIAIWLLVMDFIAVLLIDFDLIFDGYIHTNLVFPVGNGVLLTINTALFVYYYQRYNQQYISNGFQVPFFDTYIEDGTINLNGKFSIVFVDNEMKDRQRGQIILKDYQQAVLSDLLNIQLVEDFDIIICDMKGVGRSPSGGKSPKEKKADPILKQIKDFYPYKYVIAISNDAGSLSEVEDIVDATVYKSPVSFVDKLDRVIQKGIKEMSLPQTYWEKIEKRLTNNHTPEKKIRNYKEAYALHLYRKRIVNQ